MWKLNTVLVCMVLAVTACGNKETKTADATPAATQQAAPASAMDKEIDAGLAQMKSKLPLKMGDVMEITSIDRTDKDINYTYTFLTDKVNKSSFKLDEGKKAAAQQFCGNPETKKYLDAGYNFNFKYNFKDGSDLVVPFKKGDC